MEVVSPDDRETEEPVPGTFLTQVVAGDRMSVQHFRGEEGGSPEQSHEHEEIGYLVEGSVTVVVDGEEYTVEAGEAYHIPGGEPHEFRETESAVGLMIFSPPRPRPPETYTEE